VTAVKKAFGLAAASAGKGASAVDQFDPDRVRRRPR
jgi:hypothetical protein